MKKEEITKEILLEVAENNFEKFAFSEEGHMTIFSEAYGSPMLIIYADRIHLTERTGVFTSKDKIELVYYITYTPENISYELSKKEYEKLFLPFREKENKRKNILFIKEQKELFKQYE